MLLPLGFHVVEADVQQLVASPPSVTHYLATHFILHPTFFSHLMAHQQKFSALKRTILLSLSLALFQDVSSLEIQSRAHHHAVASRAVAKRAIHTEVPTGTNSSLAARALGDPWAGAGWYEQFGNSGINGMQLAPVNDRYVILLDKAEQNPLRTADGNHAWAAMFDTRTGVSRPLFTTTNSFCAGTFCFIESMDNIDLPTPF